MDISQNLSRLEDYGFIVIAKNIRDHCRVVNDVKIEPTWKKALNDEFSKEYWEKLSSNVRDQYLTKTIYPPAKMFSVLLICAPYEKQR